MNTRGGPIVRAVIVGVGVAVAAGAVALAAGGTDGSGGAGDAGGLREAALAPAKRADRPVSFGSCAALSRYASRRATGLVGPYGYGGYPVTWRGGPAVDVMPVPVPATAPDATVPPAAPTPERTAAPAVATPAEGVDFSGTNVQEAGVDEPDIVKTDGRHIYVADSSGVRALAAGGTPRQVDHLPLDLGHGDAQLLLVGDRLLVISTAPGGGIPSPRPVAASTVIAPGPTEPPAVLVRLVDVSDPSSLRVRETMRVEGRLVGARLSNGAVRLVVGTTPDPLTFVNPGSEEAPTAQEAVAQNRRVVQTAHVRTWLPTLRITRAGRRAGATALAVRCRDVRRTTQFSGLGTLSVLTLDPAKGVTPVDRDAIMTDGDIVYGSGNSLFVTTPRWVAPDAAADDVPTGAVTQIHRFDTSRPDQTVYRSSGRVPGFLLNQFSLSEHEGHLRVASTEEPSWVAQEAGEQSQSTVTVLAERDQRLVRVGSVGGLGRNERIYAVRFIGDTGYVVTFRQTDPLYVVDLSTPTRPVVRGELKIPGYSAYLHPVGEGLLLGVGQDADAQGRVRGTQVSLFDVSDPTAPKRLHQTTLGRGWSEAEHDHHAFLYWAPTGLAVVPVDVYDDDYTYRSEAVGLRVDRLTGFRRVAAIRHPDTTDGYTPRVRRSLVVGDRVFTVSEAGLGVNALDGLGSVGFVRFR